MIQASGTAGRDVTVSVPAEKRQVGRYVAGLIERLGYRSHLRVHRHYGAFHSHAADSRNHVQIGTDGWAADFPTPIDFTTPFTCGSQIPGSTANVNLAQFCDRELERRIDAAVAARGSAADARWRGAYDRLASTREPRPKAGSRTPSRSSRPLRRP